MRSLRKPHALQGDSNTLASQRAIQPVEMKRREMRYGGQAFGRMRRPWIRCNCSNHSCDTPAIVMFRSALHEILLAERVVPN